MIPSFPLSSKGQAYCDAHSSAPFVFIGAIVFPVDQNVRNDRGSNEEYLPNGRLKPNPVP
jgi:hypothetical protein